MKEKVSCSPFRFGNSLRQAFALVIIIHLAGFVFAGEGQQASPPASPPAPTAEKPVVTTPPVMAPPSEPAPQPQKEVASSGAEKLAPVIVTGSLLPSAATAGVAPVDTVEAIQIQQSGSQDVLATLKALSPAFTGGENIGQTLNNGGYGEAYIALRNLPTLVLIDGQRINITPFSTFVGTYAADVNTIPVSLIDHIEILKDGASTIYGSDAIGGVVNIITKKDFNGAEVSGRYGFGVDKGHYTEDRASAIYGFSTNGTRLVLGMDYYHSDPLLTKDRSVGSLTSVQLAKDGFGLPPSYYSGSYPGRAGDADGNVYIVAGSPFAKGAPGYIAGLNAPPVIPGGPFTTVAAYNAAALANPAWSAAHPGLTPYINVNTTPAFAALGSAAILNTTTLGTYSDSQQDRWSPFVNFEQDVLGKQLTIYEQLLYTHSESTEQLAPAPIPALGDYFLTLPANNPGNVFGVNLGSGAAIFPSIRSRLIEVGNRAFDTTSDFWHLVGGVKGDVVDDRFHYDVNADYSRTSEKQEQNSASSILLNEAMTPLSGNPNLSQLVNSKGANVPIYNILALPGVNSPETINAIRASAGQGGLSDLFSGEGIFRGDIYELPAGTFQLAIGAQYVHETLNTTADPLLASGNLIGLNAIPPYPGGSRDREAGFVEARIPVISPRQNIPGVHDFEIDASGRYETIESPDNTHDDLVPKVGFRWQPLDEQLTIRGTYSQGFNVPPLTQLYGPPLQSEPYVVTPTSGTDPTPTVAQQTDNQLSNKNIPPSTAETFTIGAVFSPRAVKHLTVSVDYYHIDQSQIAMYPSPSAIVADLNKNGSSSIWFNNPNLHGTPIYVDQNNNPYVPTAGNLATSINYANFGTLNLPLVPGGQERTEGLDLAVDYRIDTPPAGSWDFFANANVTMAYDVKFPGGSNWISYKGQYTDAQLVSDFQGLIPDYNLTVGLTWSIQNFDYTVIAHYLPGVTDYGDMQKSIGAPTDDFTANGKPWQVSDYYKIDMQLAYNFRSASGKEWYDGTRVDVGVSNVTDSKPPLISSSSEDNTDKSAYDIIGRFVYFETAIKF